MSQGNMDVKKVGAAAGGSDALKAGELVKDQNGYEFAGNGKISTREAAHRILDIENEQSGNDALPQQGAEREALDGEAAKQILSHGQNAQLNQEVGGNVDTKIPSAAAVGGQSKRSTLHVDNDSISSLKALVKAAGPALDAYKQKMMLSAPSPFGQTNAAIGAVRNNGGLQLPVEDDL